MTCSVVSLACPGSRSAERSGGAFPPQLAQQKGANPRSPDARTSHAAAAAWRGSLASSDLCMRMLFISRWFVERRRRTGGWDTGDGAAKGGAVNEELLLRWEWGNAAGLRTAQNRLCSLNLCGSRGDCGQTHRCCVSLLAQVVGYLVHTHPWIRKPR